MDFQTLLDPEIQKFIAAHEKDDVAKLALKPMPDKDWDRVTIMDQIKARQKARHKVPHWFENENILMFPAANLVEQASSAATALYKSSVFKGETFVDLTGGMGVDSWAFSQSFTKGVCIEHNVDAAKLLAHNLPQICEGSVDVVHASAEKFIETMENTGLVFIDPQRRDNNAKGKFRFEDCSPDIVQLLPALKDKAKTIVIKASPMMDIQQGIEQLECVTQVHVLEKQQNCKEVLFVMEPDTQGSNPEIIAAALDENGKMLHRIAFLAEEELQYACDFALPQTYLYEPGPAFIKSGGIKILCKKYAVSKLHPHTHLYTSQERIDDFPGRIFKINGVHKAQTNDIPEKKANLAVRNFPMSVENLRKKLKIAEGGDMYYFACTLMDDRKIVLSAVKG
ncbi:MAG: hypothetical protein JKY71_02320 [Alphaproteobacteria bacterium]|nr:hypothetical protein [Alphaproteobacteria bacterium]